MTHKCREPGKQEIGDLIKYFKYLTPYKRRNEIMKGRW